MNGILFSTFAATGLFMACAPLLRSQTITIPVIDDVVITLPSDTRVADADHAINWTGVTTLTAQLRENASLKLWPAPGIQVEIWVHHDSTYAQGVRALSRMQWLTFLARMEQTQLVEIRKRSGKSGAAFSGDYVGGRYRSMIGRSSWYDGPSNNNTLTYDVFHGNDVISLLFTWTAPEGSAMEGLVDMILSSIDVRDAR